MMKILLFVLVSIFCFSQLSAQTIEYSEDFESYADGSFVAQSSGGKFTTWTNNPGGADDANISTEHAYSGTKSIRLYSNVSTGGPADLILPLPNAYVTGIAEMSWYMYVRSGASGYFNLQSRKPVGTTWGINAIFNADGTYVIDGEGTIFSTGTFNPDTWFKFTIKANLTLNRWEIFLDDAKIASYNAVTNSFYGIDFFPFNPVSPFESEYYVDNVYYKFVPHVPKPLDAAVTKINISSKVLKGKLYTISGQIRNIGNTNITSIEVEWSDGTNTFTKSISGINIAKNAVYNIALDQKFVTNSSTANIYFRIIKINTVVDDDPSNNTLTIQPEVVVPAEGKKVFIEEATGTWCQWCPRGAVFLDLMDKEYNDYVIPIAVHGGSATEPMLPIQPWAANLPITGYPSMVVDRKSVVDPSAIEGNFFNLIINEPLTTIINKASFNPTTNEITVEVEATAKVDLNGDYRLNLAIVEDSVRGTTSFYNQSNAYANNAAGPMGGYENLPNPVPASRMIYRHVGRSIVGNFDGVVNSFPASLNAGQKTSYTFTYVVPATQKINQISLVGFVIAPDGTIDNATSTHLSTVVATKDLPEQIALFEISPNPTYGNSRIELDLKESASVSVQLSTLDGVTIATKNYGKLTGSQIFPIQTDNLFNGIYNVQLHIGNKIISKKLVVLR
ncbi:MAG: Omp28-related outer membrane protein [Bacteroidota bacterium]|nr:Omp28-related outer membrane protein [Bacteroidota bacterium]